MPYSYFYSDAEFTDIADVDIGILTDYINASNLASGILQYITNVKNQNGTYNVELVFDVQLSAPDEAELTLLIANYTQTVFANISAIITDTKTPGTNGGTFTAGSWITRALNTISSDQNFCSLASNQFTILAGSYHIDISACACSVNNHQIRLFDITNNSTVAVSTNGYTKDSNDLLSIYTSLIINSDTTYEIQHQCSNTVEGYGFGRSVGFGEPEIYCRVVIYNELNRK